MTDLGQSRHFHDVLLMSAHPSTAAQKWTCRQVGSVPQGDMHLPFFLRQGLRDLAGLFDEKLRDGTEPAGLQGDDANWDSRH